MSRKRSWNTILVFCILIFGFTAATLLKPSSEFSETENRALAQMPKMELESILNGDFEADYEEYLTDQFVLRDAWIGLKTASERAQFRQESKDIYFAEDGYLIEKHTGAFTSEQAAQNQKLLAQFCERYEPQFGAEHMTVMLIPNAVDILEDLLPPFAVPCEQEGYLTQVQDALPEGVWFDAGAVLREHKDEELYYRTDHHWKTGAAFLVYQEWAREQGFVVPSESDYEIRTAVEDFEGTIQAKLGIHTAKDTLELYLPKKDIFYTMQINGAEKISYSLYDETALDTRDKYAVYFGGNQALVRLKARTDSDRRLLVLKDSYAHCFVPFALEEFEQIDLVDVRYYNQKLSGLIVQEGYTDLLVLYNAAGFAEDVSLAKLLG